jgi:hypothetical protein
MFPRWFTTRTQTAEHLLSRLLPRGTTLPRIPFRALVDSGGSRTGMAATCLLAAFSVGACDRHQLGPTLSRIR